MLRIPQRTTQGKVRHRGAVDEVEDVEVGDARSK
jgi:hypothetical protein